MSVKILHLSDLHLGKCVYQNNVEELACKIVSELNENNLLKFDGIVVTGDIFDASIYEEDSGIDKWIEEAAIFFEALIKLLDEEQCEIIKENVLFCPGNHDVQRLNDGIDLSVFVKFLKRFYGDEIYMKKYKYYKEENSDTFFSVHCYEQEKIAIVSLNSCCAMKDKRGNNKVKKVLEKIDFNNLNVAKYGNVNVTELKKEIIEQVDDNYEDYLDYGYISDYQLLKLKGALKDINGEDYTIVGMFHHPLQLFPDSTDKMQSDISVIKNASTVIDRLMTNKINIVLHGHKHMALINPITNDSFLHNMNNIIYAIAAGSIGKENITNRMFQVVEIFNKLEEPKKIRVIPLEYSQEKCTRKETIEIPPKQENIGYMQGIIKEILQEHNMYNEYIDKVQEVDLCSQKHGINRIIEFIERTILNFPEVRKRVLEIPELGLFSVLVVHLRVNSYAEQNNKKEIEVYFKEKKELFNIDEKYCKQLLDFINTSMFDNDKQYRAISDEGNNKYKIYSGLTLAITLITDIYLYLSRYTNIYFEKIKHKMNINVTIEEFATHIPEPQIMIASVPDRREMCISFKSKHPSFHKVALIMIKNIEARMNKYEKCFGNIGLKIYYIKSEVEKYQYTQEDYNFEAYLPTLMPLLIGDNLYRQKEVFIRELIQNSYDAIMLRRKVDEYSEEGKIQIEMGIEKNASSNIEGHRDVCKYISISDNGVGMNLYNIERYFTGIGRSYYKSTDFLELEKRKGTRYEAISNFGIGFLSCFMVADDIQVDTTYYEQNDNLIHIKIPNYEGCFFVNEEQSENAIGTKIVLYEKQCSDKVNMDFEKILDYMRDTFIDFPMDINIDINGNKYVIPSHVCRKDISKKGVWMQFFIDQNGKVYEKGENKDYGMYIKFDEYAQLYADECKILNSGIYLNEVDDREYSIYDEVFTRGMIINYPPNLISLDVSREKIIGRRFSLDHLRKDISNLVIKNLLGEFKQILNNNKSVKTYQCIIGFLLNNKFNIADINNLISLLPVIYIGIEKNKIRITTNEKIKLKQCVKIKTIYELAERYIERADEKNKKRLIEYVCRRRLLDNEFKEEKHIGVFILMNIMESLEYRYTLGFNRMNDESSIKGEFKKVLNDVCNRTDTKIEDVSPFQLEIIILLSAILMCFTYKNLEEGIELTISSMVYTHLETIYNVLNKNEE